MRTSPSWSLALISLTLTAGCVADLGASDALGVVTAELGRTPPDVSCVRVRVSRGALVLRDERRDTAPGAAVSLPIEGLPYDTLSFRADAYGVACASLGSSTIARWSSEDVEATLAPGPMPTLVLEMRPNRPAGVDVGFRPWIADVVVADGVTALLFDDGTVRGIGTSQHVAVLNALTSVRALALAGDHGCYIDTASRLRCWGYNLNGQLGTGATSSGWTSTPTLSFARPLRAVVAAPMKTCVITTSDELWCFGQNSRGELGTFATSEITHPTRVAQDVAEVALSYTHACYRSTIAARVRCTGANEVGQLGNGSSVANSTYYVDVPGLRASRIDAGGATTVAMRLDGTVVYWGQLPGAERAPVPTTLPGSEGVAIDAIAAGNYHVCALVDGQVRCAGRNERGALGDGGASVDRGRLGDALHEGTISLVRAGGERTCALDDTNDLVCWGAGSFGANGDGTTEDRFAPVRVTW